MSDKPISDLRRRMLEDMASASSVRRPRVCQLQTHALQQSAILSDRLQRSEWQGVAAHQDGLARDRHAAIDLLEARLGIGSDCARIAWIGVSDDPWRADLEQTLDEEADEGRAVTLAYQFRLADELVDAASSERLIAAGMIGFRVRVPALNIADGYIIAFDHEWVDRRVDDVFCNPRQAAHRIAPPFPHVFAQEPFPKQWQVGGSDCAKPVGGVWHPQVSICVSMVTLSTCHGRVM